MSETISPATGSIILSSFRTITLVLFLTACESPETRVASGNKTGTLHWGNGTEPQSLDPHIATGVPEHHIISALMEGLVRKDSNTLEPVPGVAESWAISEDSLVYTFRLRPDLKWSNGDALDAHDFVWSWWRALQPALGNLYAYMYFPIANARRYYEGKLTEFDEVGVKALDKLTLQVSLENPTPYFLQLLDHYSMFPVHQATIENFGKADQRGTRWTHEGNMVSNGPFKLKKWSINREIIVERNALYYDNANVRLNAIVYYPIENGTTEERMFRAEQLHYTNDVPIDKIETYSNKKAHSLRINPYLGTYYYRLNTRVEHLQNKKVRRALALTIDRERLTKHVLKGRQIPAYAMTPPDTKGYFPPVSLEFDPEKARELMALSGYPNGKGFPPTEILYNTNEAHRKVAVAIQQMWKKHLNIDVSLINQEWKVYLDSETSGDYQISRAGWIGDYVDPNNFLDMFICEGGNNRTGWCNTEYDRLVLEEAPRGETDEERFDIFRKAETILMDELPIIPIYTYTSKNLVHASVKNLDPNILNQPSYTQIYLEGETD
ncbi:MAG: peptide ABC transporter substrate-binding protein [Gammaproteobacteria bacterium]|nr:peptide ABC transporter substrate-binding protein [Gammaproteobacteria bacterium]